MVLAISSDRFRRFSTGINERDGLLTSNNHFFYARENGNAFSEDGVVGGARIVPRGMLPRSWPMGNTNYLYLIT